MKLGARSSESYCPLPNHRFLFLLEPWSLPNHRSLFLLEPWSLPKHGVYFSREFVPFLKHRSLFSPRSCPTPPSGFLTWISHPLHGESRESPQAENPPSSGTW